MRLRRHLGGWFVATALLGALPVQAQSSAQVPADVVAAVLQHAALVEATYADTLAAAQDLRVAVVAFIAEPSAERLEAARRAWLDAREWYGQSEAFRFYGGPIDEAGGPEGRLNAWPMDESYVDSVKGKPNSGLINDRRFVIGKKALAAQNERGGEENVATGWHALEFLLWGQDFNEHGPGDRSHEDFIDGQAPNADRRRQYLGVVIELLIDDLESLVRAWAGAEARGGKANYRARFERGGIESVRKIIVGLGSLSRGELAGKRTDVAMNTRDQEDEQSCFSDNTHRDLVANALGIENVWLGRYQRRGGSMLQGASLRELVATRDEALAARATTQIAASVAAAQAIQPPFDQEINGGADGQGRLRVQALIDSAVQQSKDLADAAAALGIRRLTLVNPKK
ncbi:MAG TPA: imelysin family protein [Burkholderiaceae bacterium]|nr:imelysin family protein [Burkholderiaceae bacterium]